MEKPEAAHALEIIEGIDAGAFSRDINVARQSARVFHSVGGGRTMDEGDRILLILTMVPVEIPLTSKNARKMSLSSKELRFRRIFK